MKLRHWPHLVHDNIETLSRGVSHGLKDSFYVVEDVALLEGHVLDVPSLSYLFGQFDGVVTANQYRSIEFPLQVVARGSQAVKYCGGRRQEKYN